MSRFFGNAAGGDALMATWPCVETDAKYWNIRAGRRDMSYWKRNESQYGARYNWATLWPSSGFMSGDRNSGYCQIGQDCCEMDSWSPIQRANRGNGATKFIMGRVKDGSGNPLGGAVVHAFTTADDVFQGHTYSDPNGYYEAGTTQIGAQHYLVAYYASGNLAGTTVNTLTPTNRDGS